MHALFLLLSLSNLVFLFLGTAGFSRALKSGAPHCTHVPPCSDSCWEFLADEPIPGPPSFVIDANRDTEALGDDQIAYRYGVDTPMSPDCSDDSSSGMLVFGFSFRLSLYLYTPIFLLHPLVNIYFVF